MPAKGVPTPSAGVVSAPPSTPVAGVPKPSAGVVSAPPDVRSNVSQGITIRGRDATE
jgi:hypothetical protein